MYTIIVLFVVTSRQTKVFTFQERSYENMYVFSTKSSVTISLVEATEILIVERNVLRIKVRNLSVRRDYVLADEVSLIAQILRREEC